MSVGGWHREDVKALLRRRYGSVAAFEQQKGLPKSSVSDVLRGRSVRRTAEAILKELNTPDTASSSRWGKRA
ncbi:MAG: helix-turn-helix domain-containing protein [Ignavibacteriales bacterium]